MVGFSRAGVIRIEINISVQALSRLEGSRVDGFQGKFLCEIDCWLRSSVSGDEAGGRAGRTK